MQTAPDPCFLFPFFPLPLFCSLAGARREAFSDRVPLATRAGEGEAGPRSHEMVTREEASGATAAGATGAGAGSLPVYNHILVPVMDRNPMLNHATKQVQTTCVAAFIH